MGTRVSPLLLFILPKDHFTRGSLKDTCHGRVHSFADHLACVVHHNHGAVIEVGDSLIEFLAFFQDKNLHAFTRQIDRLEGIGELINVEDLDTAKLCDFIQIEIVGDDLCFKLHRQFNQFHIYFANCRIVVFDKLDRDTRHLLNLLKNIQATPPAIALQGIGGICNLLKLAKHKMGNNQNSIEEARLANVGDTAVDDDAGIEYFVNLLYRPLAAENSP